MKQTVRIGNQIIRTDFGFILILLLLFGTSIFALYNAFNLISEGSSYYYMIRQLMWYGVGFFVMFIITRVQNKELFSYLNRFYKFLNIILIYMILSKICYSLSGGEFHLPLAGETNGAFSWLSIPLLGSFQASEFMKIVLIIKVSQIISAFQSRYPDPTVKQDIQMFIQIIKWCALPLILILMQPDTGVFMIIAFTLLILILCSGIRKTYVWIIFGLIAVFLSAFIIIYIYFPDTLSMFMSGYQIKRIDSWLNPEDNILGSSNQLYTALLSLGSAGLTGYGMQANIISIPEAHTDFIFAAFGQCFGLIGTIYILLVCLILDLYLCRMAFNTQNRTDRLIIIGTIAMLLYQQTQNLGMIIGLIPITGITLPLISYGGSSTLSYFILFGVILNLSPSSKKVIKIRVPGTRKKRRAKRKFKFNNPFKRKESSESYI